MEIWLAGTLNQLFIRGSYTGIVGNSGKTPFFVNDQFCTPHFILS